MHRTWGVKMKFEFLNDTIQMRIDPFGPSVCGWNRRNMLIHSLIMNSIDASISQSTSLIYVNLHLHLSC